MWLVTWLWLLALSLLATVWLVALAMSVVAVVMTVRSRGGRAGLLVVLVAATIYIVDWRSVFAVGWSATHRNDFVAVERLTRSGELGAPERWGVLRP